MPPVGLDQMLAFFYRPQGRIGRAEYALGVGFIQAINLAILSFVLLRMEASPGAIVLAVIIGIPLSIAMFVLIAKRCHDLGLPGTFLLLIFVPIAGLAWLVALLFIPGNATPNLYGPPPSFRRV